MTDAELTDACRKAREIIGAVGSLHAMWDVVADAEAILGGRPAILPRAAVERALSDFAASRGRRCPS